MSKFDLEIDRAVREMLDVEPPDGLRGRVLERLESPGRGFSWIWIAAPVAAAAVIILALVLPSTTSRPVVNPATTVATAHPIAPPAPVTTGASGSAPGPAQTAIARSAPPRRPARTTNTVAAANDVIEDVVWIDPLALPPSIAVAAIEPPRAPSVPSIEPALREIPALEVRPISDTPRERRNQE